PPGELLVHVLERHRVAGERALGGDAAAHDPRAYDEDPLGDRCARVALREDGFDVGHEVSGMEGRVRAISRYSQARQSSVAAGSPHARQRSGAAKEASCARNRVTRRSWVFRSDWRVPGWASS